MAKPPSAFVSLLQQKCPHCRSQKVFSHRSYSSSFLKMHEHCPHCNMNFEPEPGFYWGAMYITYGFNTGLALTMSFILYMFFGNPSIWWYVGVIGVIGLILTPLFFRYSRMMMLYWLGGKKFDPKYFKEA